MELLTVKEVAKKLKISEVTVRRWIKKDKLKAIRIGRDYRIKKKNFKEFLDSPPDFSSLDDNK